MCVEEGEQHSKVPALQRGVHVTLQHRPEQALQKRRRRGNEDRHQTTLDKEERRKQRGDALWPK